MSRINQAIKLDNGNSYVILKQVVYKNENYYLASKLDLNNNPIAEELVFFHEFNVDDVLKIEEVTDVELMNYLYTYMKI